jgi:hypothetical protein
MIISFGQLITGAYVIKFELDDEKGTFLMSNYIPRPLSSFPAAVIDNDLMKSLYRVIGSHLGLNKCALCYTFLKKDEPVHCKACLQRLQADE